MLKKFFVVVIVVLLALSLRIVDAENIDWDSAPRIGNKAELARYIENRRRNGETKFYVVLVNGFRNENPNDFLDWVLAQQVDMTWDYQADGTARMIYEIIEYPGTRVANAYLNGNINDLTPEEKQLYDAAVSIVNEAKKYSSSLDRELYIHDAICKHTTFISDVNKDATGVLIYGQANCQGYTDAFYMLGRMCGLNVRRVQGVGDGESHAWNTIEFDDGKAYCVDVTFDDRDLFDELNSYVYFNAPLEIMKETHSYQWDAIPNLQRSIDNRYSYRAFNEFAQASSAEEGLHLIARKLSEENKIWFAVMTPFDERFSEENVQQTADYVAKLSGKNINLSTWQRGNYLFFTVTVM